MTGKTDTCIIGGGVMGLATAYYLTKAGKKVLLMEKDAIGAGASGACDDMILLQSKRPGIALTLAMESLELYQSLSEELGGTIGFETRGGVVLIEDDRQLAVMEEHVRQQVACGLKVEIIDRKALRKKQPHVSDRIIASTYSATDSQVEPLRLMRALLHSSLERGLAVQRGVQPLSITRDHCWRIETRDGMVECETLVIASGAWSGQVGALAGVEIPVVPRRGQIAITEQISAFGETNAWTAAYIASKLDPSLMPDKGPYARQIGLGFSLSQTLEGNYLIGSTREDAGFDKTTSLRSIATVTKQAQEYFPLLAQVSVIRTISGFRPATPDGSAIVGPVDGAEGLFVATGHEGDGVALAPVTGRAVADMVLGRFSDKRYDALNLRRFAAVRA